MVPPRKRKVVQTSPITATLTIGNCIVEFPSDVDQEYSAEKLCLQVHQPAAIRISVDKWNIQASGTSSPLYSGHVLPMGISFQVLNSKSLDKINHELLESTIQLYKQELPAMSFAADTGKESDFLRNCTTNGKYCTLLMKKPGVFPADPEIVVGAITYQILPTSTQYAEIPLAAVDQSCQRQGLGKLLVRELARRLADVGVLTLFCWGDQESEHFWNKQGFLKIAEVDAQGRPQKLRLKNEIRKAMSLPGNSALMVCNLPQVNAVPPPMSAGERTPHRNSGTINATHTIEKEVKTMSDTTHVEGQQSPTAYSDVSDPYSLGSTPCRVPLSSDARPGKAAVLTSRSNCDGAQFPVKTYARGSSNKVSAVANPELGSKPNSSAKSNRSLRFAGVDQVMPTEKDASESAPAASPGHLVVTPECENSGPIVVNPATEMICEKALLTSSSKTLLHSDGESREPLRNVQNTCGNDIVAPVKKRPWKKTQSDNPAAAQGLPKSTGREFGPEKENKEPARKGVLETELEGSDGKSSLKKAGLKRPRPETLPVKTVGRRSVRRRRGDSPSPTVNLVFQTPEPLVPEPTPLSEQLPETVNHGAVLNTEIVSATRCAEIVYCKQSMADESFSPSGGGEENLNSRLKKQGKDSTIRKRSSTRLVQVPDDGNDSSELGPGHLKDPAKASTPVVFLMNMPNDPKKRALAQLVEKLGGKVTGDGGQCTHVVTSEVRRTLNFCTALCNGAWVVSPDWLKASSRHKSFVDEKLYLLRDKQFESKYKVTLASVIQTAQRRPCSLFAGFYVYPTPHVQPPLDTVVKLTEAAGGKIVSTLDEALQQNDASHTIVLACEEDMKEGEIAAKAGLQTITGEWFMQAIVKQRIDFSAKVTEKQTCM